MDHSRFHIYDALRELQEEMDRIQRSLRHPVYELQQEMERIRRLTSPVTPLESPAQLDIMRQIDAWNAMQRSIDMLNSQTRWLHPPLLPDELEEDNEEEW